VDIDHRGAFSDQAPNPLEPGQEQTIKNLIRLPLMMYYLFRLSGLCLEPVSFFALWISAAAISLENFFWSVFHALCDHARQQASVR
jgi:hypothetical protein